MSTPQQNPRVGDVGVYGRVSSEEQARGESIDRQIEAGCEFIEHKPEMKSLAVRKYRDPGYSGHNFDRPGMTQLIADTRAGLLRYVVVRDVSRFARNVKLGLQLLDEFHAAGVDLMVVSTPWLDTKTTQGRRLFTDSLTNAESERGTYRDNAIFGMTTRAQRGLWKGGLPPVGYTVDNGILQIIPSAGIAIQKIFREFSKTGSFMAVLRAADRQGDIQIPLAVTRGRPPDAAKPRFHVITIHFLRRLLRSPVYVGYVPCPRVQNELNKHQHPDLVLPSGRRYFKGKHQPMVSEKLWRRVQTILDQAQRKGPRRGHETPEYLLQGLLTCSCCKLSMNVSTGTSHTRKVKRCYVCRDVIRRGTTSRCTVRRMPAEELEAATIRFLGDLAQHPEIIAGIVDGASHRKGYVAKELRDRIRLLKEERAKIERAEKIAVDRFFDVRDTALGRAVTQRFDELEARERAIGQEIGELEIKLRSVEANNPSVAEVTAALSNFERMVAHLSRPQIKELIKLLVAEIAVAKIHHQRDRRYAGFARSSLLLTLSFQLSAAAMKLSKHPLITAHDLRFSESADRATMAISLTMEVRRGGPRGNKLHFLAPFGGGADIVAIQSAADRETNNAARLEHPLWRADQIAEMQSKGMLKKDIARSFGKTAPFVTYHLRLAQLQPAIREALKAAPLQILRHFGLVRLMRLAAQDVTQQEEAFTFEYRKATEVASKTGAFLKPA